MTAPAKAYHLTHQKLRRLRGRAAEQRCARCGRQASAWAYDGTDPVEMRATTYDGKQVRYSADLSRYEPLCSTCHHVQDHPPKTHCVNGHELTDDNTYVKPNGWRQCRRCKRETQQAWRAEHPNWRSGVTA